MKIKSLIDKGFLHIFGSNVINKVIQFSSGIVLVRLLSKEQFGLFTYVENIILFFIMFSTLGVDSGLLQFGSETKEKDKLNKFVKFAFKIGISASVLTSIVIFLYSEYFPLKIEGASPLLKSMLLMPIAIGVFQLVQIYFRVNLENKKFSSLSTLNTFLIFIFTIFGAYFYDVLGVVIFKYFAYAISIFVGIYLIGNRVKYIYKSIKLPSLAKKEFMKFSLISSFNNSIAQLLYIIDIFLIGLIIADENIIATYKIATLIPFALNFIPSSIVTFIYPYFARNNKDVVWIKRNYLKLLKYLFILNLFITIILVTFAPIIIRVLFGSQYEDAVIPFVILSIGYFIAGTFRIPIGNILLMMKEVKFNMYLAIVTGLLNIVLDILLIKNYGSNGAAISTLGIFIFTSIISFSYLMYKLNKPKKII